MKKINGIIMQYFEWYMDCKQNLWNNITKEAEKLADLGITALWLPPAYKGMGGKDEVGYAVYDLYDLGEFDQKGTIKTKYGSKDEYLNCIQVLKQSGIETYADIVLNHKMGADMLQTIPANKVEWGNHNVEEPKEEINENISVERVKIINENGEKAIGKPIGNYITIDIKNLKIAQKEEIEQAANTLTNELKNTLENHIDKQGEILVVGLRKYLCNTGQLGTKGY